MIPEHLGPTRGPQTFFITSSTDQKKSVFQVEQWARIFLKNLYKHKKEKAYLLHCFVLMPDHFHLLITPVPDTTLEKSLQFIKGGSAYELKQAGRTGSAVWQRGYTDHRVRDGKEYEEIVIYIHQNPVKAGLVQKAEDYKYSSAYPGWKLDPPRSYLSG
ncbi:MAG TPA: transposase [Terriglobales bacterium]|nr:transposase [Terriglobales bacterium]